MRNKLLLPALGLTIFGATLFGTSVLAQEEQQYPDIVKKIAQRFNLNETEVKAVFDEHKNEHKAQIQKRFEEKLNQAVADGKITETQKAAIQTKFQEVKNQMPEKRENMKNMTPDERKQAFEQKRTELENWAKQNGIDLQTLQDLLGHHKGRFHVKMIR